MKVILKSLLAIAVLLNLTSLTVRLEAALAGQQHTRMPKEGGHGPSRS